MSVTDISQSMLEHAFRVEDNTISVLIKALEKAQVPPENIGAMARSILQSVHQAQNRQELATLLEQLVQQYPELDVVQLQEELYAKVQKEQIIKKKIEELVQQDKVDEAFQLAQSINRGELPLDIQQEIDTI